MKSRLLPCVCALLALPAGAAWADCPTFGPQNLNFLEQTFPPDGPAETGWRLSFGHADGKGLWITGADFRKGPNEPYMRVLYDARLSDIFVPYHPGQPRYLDLSEYDFALVPVQPVDLGPCGAEADDWVVKEVRDRGILWKNDEDGLRGYELVLWATLDAANYNYLIAYHFRDDGSIGFRLAATAVNLPGDELTAHMHNGLWRVDVDLAGSAADTVGIHIHNETINSNVASDAQLLFNNGKEGFADANPLQFTMLSIIDTAKKNAQGKLIGYDVMAPREGSPRHKENFAHHDYWVTVQHAVEQHYPAIATYVANQESIASTDIVLWYISPMHHMPRSEDGSYVGGNWVGVAHAMWGGFDLRPRNLFDTTPFYP